MDIISPDYYPKEEWRAGVMTRMLVSARNGATQLCLFEQWVDPGIGPPSHHHAAEEVLTVLAGEAEMWIDDERAVLRSGQSLIVPANRLHGFRNAGSATLHIHAVLALPVFEAIYAGSLVQRWLPDAAAP